MHLTSRLLPFALVGFGSALAQNMLVVPNANTSASGNTTSPYPATAQSVEIQELVGAGQFHSSPITITALSFRAAPGAGPVNFGIPTLKVYLSTSPNFPNTNGGGSLMSTTFANNVGPDKTLIFSGGLAEKDSGCAAPGPCPFDLYIGLETPFVYSPTAGPLLIDLQETNVSGSGALDAASFSAPGGSVATVSGTLGAATGTFSYSGPIVQITYTTAAPMITGVVNVASNIPPGMPNYGIAQGSLFAVYGSQMGPATLAASSLPLQTAVSGTSMTVSMSGTTLNVPIYFTRQDIVVGVMPSNTPIGTAGTLTLTYNNLTGNMPVTVVQSGFGISNNVISANNNLGILNNASVTFENYQSVTPTNTAKPGDVLTIWGTGLGATPNNGGDTTAPPAGNIGAAPQVFVGGVPSTSITYWGRSPGVFPGLDQINFVVPQGVPLGCNVSIVVETMNGATPFVSNGPTIALAATDGATCSDPTAYIPTADLSLASAKVLFLQTQEGVNVNPGPNGTSTTQTFDQAFALLFSATQAQVAALAPQVNTEPSFGSCYVGVVSATGSYGPNPSFTPLNAGNTITLTPPTGAAISLTAQSGQYQSAEGSTAIPGGTWSFSNGSGGPDVGSLSFKFPVPLPVTWSNQNALLGSTVNRANPLTITWTGGDANGYIDIQGVGNGGSALAGTFLVGFECAVPESAGQFTIPPSIMLGVPPSNGNLRVSTFALPNILGSVTGFNVAVSGSSFYTQIPVTFK